jgi:hypothetical protein
LQIDWNPILRARAGEPVLRNAARSGGRSLSGRGQRVMSDAGFWEIPVSSIVVNTREKAAAYRAMLARLRQGEEVIFSLCDLYTSPGARDASASVTVADATALRATQINLIANGVTITPGHYFSLGGERLHLITEILADPDTDPVAGPWVSDPSPPWNPAQSPWAASRPAGSWQVRIVLPLRAAANAGAAANFKDLRLRCVPQDLGDGDLSLDLGRFGNPSLTLIESI